MRILIIVLGIIFFSFSTTGQEKKDRWKSFPASSDTAQSIDQTKKTSSDSVPIVKQKQGSTLSHTNTQIDDVNNLFIEQSKANPTISGYTILVYSGSGANSKLKARNSLINFESLYPDYPTHLAWKSPNYELRVGDFRTKLEAEKLLITIQKDFPTAFVKVANIELPPVNKDSSEMKD